MTIAIVRESAPPILPALTSGSTFAPSQVYFRGIRPPSFHGRFTATCSLALGNGLSIVLSPQPTKNITPVAIATIRWYVGRTSRRTRMGINYKILAALAVVCALAVAPIAAAAGGASATATPTHVKAGKLVELKISGLKAGERIKAHEVIPSQGGQARTLYPKQRASAGGVIIMSIRAQLKGQHNWTFTGRQSHKKA